MTLEEWRTVFSGFTLISIIFVILNYWLSRSKAKKDSILTRDKEICEQAIIAIERAFSSLTYGKGKYELPEASRLNWLTSARQIERFKELKSRIKSDLYKLVCAEHEEHWKHEFYLCLPSDYLIQPSYFKDGNIHLKSALVIMNFKQWAPNSTDPLDNVDGLKLTNDGYTLNGQHGLKTCIAQSKPEGFH